MPQLFRFGEYVIYFWSNENDPLEPIHVHISKGKPIANGSKIWITKTGRALKANNNAKIPEHILNSFVKMIEVNSEEIIQKWKEQFGEISYYC